MDMDLDINQCANTAERARGPRVHGHSVTAAKHLQSSAGDKWLPLPVLGRAPPWPVVSLKHREHVQNHTHTHARMHVHTRWRVNS